jgi:Protein of unknown function (DUF3995)
VELTTAPGRRDTARPGQWPAWAALVVGLAYAGISGYWALGGTWLLDTVGRSLASGGPGGAAAAAAWAAAGLKVIAAVLPLLAASRALAAPPAPRRRPLRILAWAKAVIPTLAWAEAVVLTLYGLVWTVAGLLVQSGLVHADAGADHRALAWHAYLWDPWFLLWGILVTAALVRSRPGRGHSGGRSRRRIRPAA